MCISTALFWNLWHTFIQSMVNDLNNKNYGSMLLSLWRTLDSRDLVWTRLRSLLGVHHEVRVLVRRLLVEGGGGRRVLGLLRDGWGRRRGRVRPQLLHVERHARVVHLRLARVVREGRSLLPLRVGAATVRRLLLRRRLLSCDRQEGDYNPYST